jgi:hypothetical protein
MPYGMARQARLLAFGVCGTAQAGRCSYQIIIISGCGMPAANGGLVFSTFDGESMEHGQNTAYSVQELTRLTGSSAHELWKTVLLCSWALHLSQHLTRFLPSSESWYRGLQGNGHTESATNRY